MNDFNWLTNHFIILNLNLKNPIHITSQFMEMFRFSFLNRS